MMKTDFKSIFLLCAYDKVNTQLEYCKHFKYQLYWDNEKQLQIVQMELRSRQESFSFIVKGKAALPEENASFLECIQSEISLDEKIEDLFFDHEIKKTFWENFKESIVFQPNFNGIGIDLKKFKKVALNSSCLL